MFSSLRTKLTLWYLGTFCLVLILFSAGVYFFVERSLHERLDANLRLTLQMESAALNRHNANSGGGSAAEALEDARFPNQIVALVDSQANEIARRPVNSVRPLRLPSFPLASSESPLFYELEDSKPDADDGCRGLYRRVSNASSTSYVLVVIESTELISDQLDALQNVLMIAIALALLLAGSGGWLLAGKSLAPVAAMAAATERITAQNLEERLTVRNSRDELGRLAATFNNLLSRLSGAFSQQRQFMADASHELRTPISVMRSAAQVTLEKPHREESEYRDALTVIEQQTRRLGRIVNDMFVLARADSSGIVVQSAAMYLDEVLAEAARTAALLAQRKGIELKIPVLSEAPFRGDEGLLRQLFINLLDNAIKYTTAGGTVQVALEQNQSEYRVTVSDTGPGISRAAQPKIFDRFFRGDESRTQSADSDGAGLGLSIARWIAEVHHGSLVLASSDASGSVFSVSLPLPERSEI